MARKRNPETKTSAAILKLEDTSKYVKLAAAANVPLSKLLNSVLLTLEPFLVEQQITYQDAGETVIIGRKIMLENTSGDILLIRRIDPDAVR